MTKKKRRKGGNQKIGWICNIVTTRPKKTKEQDTNCVGGKKGNVHLGTQSAQVNPGVLMCENILALADKKGQGGQTGSWGRRASGVNHTGYFGENQKLQSSKK